jgi:hypothetical protein
MKPFATFKKQSDLTRDQRIQVNTLRDIEWKYEQIAQQLEIILRQVQYPRTHRLTSQKIRSNKKSIISDDAREILVAFCQGLDI